MYKNNLYDALEELILERINAHHLDEPESVGQAYVRLTEVTDKLRETFTEGQRRIFTECENAYGVYEGETINVVVEGSRTLEHRRKNNVSQNLSRIRKQSQP